MKGWRINLIFIFFLLFSTAILSRLIYLQILKGDFYKALSQGLHNSFYETQGERGKIFLKNGEPLAINIDSSMVFASPEKISNLDDVVQKLSDVLNLKRDIVLDKLKSDSSNALIKKGLTDEEIDGLKKLDLKGIFLNKQKERYYPQKGLTSQVVGFVGGEGMGQYGLEEYYDDILQGKKDFRNPQNGADLILTIDYNIQFESKKLLEEAKENYDIEKGQIIVIDPTSGEVLAMVNFPDFDPNYYQDYAKEGKLNIFKNRCTQDLFEPGSVLKSITMAAALNEEKITPQTTYIDKGNVKIGGYTIYNYHRKTWGKRTMTEVLERSINTGAIFVQEQLGHNSFLKYIEKFGLFEPTGIDLQETYSQNNELRNGREVNFATASFGQGIEITPLQLVRAYCAIANGGYLIKPYLVDKILEKDKIIQTKTEFSGSIISPKTASQLTAMLVNVVEEGSGRLAKIPGYYIAGKTGTAQVSFSSLGVEKSGYSEKTIQTFIGFFPAFNPRFLILVKLDNPKTETAELSAAPIFRDLAEYIIHLYKIPPNHE